MKTASGYDSDLRHCAACRDYVPYLLSPRSAYCARCGGTVDLFSPEDMASFRRGVAQSRELSAERDSSWNDAWSWRRSAT